MKILDVPQSGSVAASTSSRNRFGQYRRTRATPVNPGSLRQDTVRGYLTQAAQAWRGLSDGVRAGWNDYAAVTPSQDSLGQTVYPTGLQRFVGIYMAALASSSSLPPGVPSESPPVPIAQGTVVADASAHTIVLTPVGEILEDEIIFVRASPQVSAGVSFMKDLRQVAVVVGGAAQTTIAIGTEYEAKYGALIEGKKIFIEIQPWSDTGGFGGKTTIVATVVA